MWRPFYDAGTKLSHKASTCGDHLPMGAQKCTTKGSSTLFASNEQASG